MTTAPATDRTTKTRVQARTWQILGATFIILGGAVAAVTGPLSWTKGSWAAAYLVLVCGVAQYLMGQVSAQGSSTLTGWWLLAGWNLGNAAVIIGALASAPYIVDAGGVILLVCLITVLVALVRRRPADVVGTLKEPVRWLLISVALILAISVPVGLLLAHLRAG